MTKPAQENQASVNCGTASAVASPIDADDNYQNQGLLYALQITLDLNHILSIFLKQLNRLVSCDGLIYCNSSQHLYMVEGSEKFPRCTYDLTLETETLGEISFCSQQGFDAGQQRILENLLGALVLPIRNALHYRIALQAASVDPLTGLKNRRAFNNHLERETSLARRSGQPLTMLVIDVDWFKRINDEIGHLGGDLVLAQIAEVLRNSIRGSDLIFRYAGDEFAILLPGMDSTASSIIIERIKANMANCCCQHGGSNIRISLSIGSAQFDPNQDAQTFFDAADMAMFTEKGHNSGNKRP